MMKFITVISLILLIENEVSCEFVCKDGPCKSQDELPKKFGIYFTHTEQKNAPCLKFSSPTNLYCFTSTHGDMKKCQCTDDSVHYDNIWCNPDLYGEEHTMCLYKDGAQPACGNVKHRGITDKEKVEIVDKHNELRAKVANGEEKRGVDGAQPKAANMRKMIWNDQLAEVAQRWADQCENRPHDKNRRIDDFSYVGQNFAWKSTHTYDEEYEAGNLLGGMVTMWYNEVKDVVLKEVEHFFMTDAVTGHYTQLAWANSYEIGCGFMSTGGHVKHHKHHKHKGGKVECVLICNYGPAGNALGAPEYAFGKPGSQCPHGTRKTDHGLCELA